MVSSDLKNSNHAENALSYLNNVKPNDGWKIDEYHFMGKKVRLLRRNISVSDENFEEVAWDTISSCVVGIKKFSSLQTKTVKGYEKLVGNGVVLVEKNGTVCRKSRIIPIVLNVSPSKTTTPNRTFGEKKTYSNIARNHSTTPSHTTRQMNQNNYSSLADIDRDTQETIIHFLVYALILVITMKILASVLTSIFVLGIPILFIAQTTCPADSSFDPKKEVKRVFRSEHLPEDRKPKSWLQKTISKVSASVTTELATGFGYEVTLIHFFGFATLAKVKIDVLNSEFFWVGAFNKWTHILKRDVNVD